MPKGRGRGFQPLLSLALFLSAFTLWTQTPVESVWQGVLRDSAAAPIAGARVRLTGKDAKNEATTSPGGHFIIAALPAGQYRLTIETKGRKIEFAQPIDVSAASPVALLTLSDRGEITLAALAGQAGAGVEISSQAVSELPLNGRDFGTLLLLAAGTMTDANGATNFTAQFAIDGQRGVERLVIENGSMKLGLPGFKARNLDWLDDEFVIRIADPRQDFIRHAFDRLIDVHRHPWSVGDGCH